MNFEVFSRGHDKAQLGESCCWDADQNMIWWVDIAGMRLLKTDARTGDTTVWQTPELPGFVALEGPDAPVVGMQTGIFAFHPGSGAFHRLVALNQPASRFNDAIVDGRGRLWVSALPLDGTVAGTVYLVAPDLALERVVDGLITPNGMAVDLTRRRFIYSDSHPDVQRIWTMPLGDGDLPAGEPTSFASTLALPGRPDGASLDEAGSYWIAGVDGSELYVFDLEGTLRAAVTVPFPAPTKISFVGGDGRSVVVASKEFGENGGFLALGQLPHDAPAGLVQPYWVPGT